MNFRNHFNPDYDEAKVLILKAKQSVILYLAATVSVVVVSIGKSVGRQRYDDVNHGSGRIWMITGKTLMPAITFLAFPVLVIISHQKIKKTFIDDFRVVKRIAKLLRCTDAATD